MYKLFKLSFFAFLFSGIQLLSFAQSNGKNGADEDALKGWHLKDLKNDKLYGISLDQAYNFLKEKKLKSKTVIVAVIDSGIDTLHEDLKPVLWKNPKEIPGNGKDDDKNGYVDDVYGWNFIGGKDGSNVNEDSYEAARVYHRLKSKYEEIENPEKLSEAEKKEYAQFERAKNNLQSSAAESQMTLMFIGGMYDNAVEADSILKINFQKEYTGSALSEYKPANIKVKEAKSTMMNLFRAFDMMSVTNTSLMSDFTSEYNGLKRKSEAFSTPPVAYRENIVKDNYNSFEDKYYGNKDVMAGTPTHGTHVSGIIGAARNNDFGMDGVADNVRLMTIRAVPDGDEHDKDIALAIRYAVDNGAKIINMSFGKSFSPQKYWVDDAVRYAQSKGVLLVHAAGNDGKDLDLPENYNFPNPIFEDNGIHAPNFITVGASGDPSIKDIAADFSNYGTTRVDVFAPGMKIYSTIPGGNTYGFLQGTSMASPVVAGLSALILSYYPTLSAEQIKECIEKSVMVPDVETTIPGSEDKAEFKILSKTGGIINAYQAVKYASGLKGSRTPAQMLK
jgi:subtilisin family serine protease